MAGPVVPAIPPPDGAGRVTGPGPGRFDPLGAGRVTLGAGRDGTGAGRVIPVDAPAPGAGRVGSRLIAVGSDGRERFGICRLPLGR